MLHKPVAKLLTLVCLSFLIVNTAKAQTYSISGKMVDAKDASPLPGVEVILTSKLDSTNRTGTMTDVDGGYEIDGLQPGGYVLETAYLGYLPISKTVLLTGKDIDLGNVSLKASDNELNSVTITGKQVRTEQLGDTTQFNADAYKTNPDATAEDLVTKMPGVTSDNSGVKVNGETVQQVYVDGKPFFGTDPTLALRNLPSEVIDKIQVFDKMSDQSQFTGFDDGNSQKTINIVTKKNKSNGQFGKIYGGYGTDDRYLAGGSFNSFNGDQRISIIELSNNVNQQNFSSQDILGVTGGSGQNRGGTRGSGGAANNFLTGQQGGITTTHSAGINYSDTWGKKIKVTGSYFFNYTDNINNTSLERNYFTQNDTSLLYNETDNSETKNLNNRFNFRLEYDIDSSNAIIFTPNLSLQENYATTGQVDSSITGGLLTSNSINNIKTNSSGYNFSGNLLYQHKFKKKGRTVSLNVSSADNEQRGDGTYYTLTDYYNSDSTTTDLLDQHYNLYNNSHNISSNVTYTEPIGKKSQLMVNYNPSYTKSYADKETDTLGNAMQQSLGFDTLLSNKYDNIYITQRAGLSYRVSTQKVNFMVGASYQYATLQGDQTFPDNFNPERYFSDVLPQAMLNFRFADGRNLRIMYRTNTTAPTITQLQDVVDVSNPLLMKTGNPNLRQDYEQTLLLRYGLTRRKSAHGLFIYGYANYINNYIGNATYLPTKDSTIDDGIMLNKGSQLTLPVNLNGYWNNKLFVTYGMPADFIKSNFNLNGGLSYTRNPGLVNSALNYSNDMAPTFGAVLSSNVSENLDFTLSYTGDYNVVTNTLQSQANDNYYNHIISFKINWIFLKGVVLNTNIAQTYYSTLNGTAPNENYILWNAYVAYKFLKNKGLEARISVFDLLNQNKSISRTVSDTYIQNSTTQVLKQYAMFTLTYTLRNFKGPAPDENSDNGGGEHHHFHGGQGGGGFGGGSPMGN